MKKVFTIIFLSILFFFRAPLFFAEHKSSQISDSEFIKLCTQFSLELENILDDSSMSKFQKEEKFHTAVVDFQKIIIQFESSSNFKFSASYKMSQTKTIISLEKILNDYLVGKISEEEVLKNVYKSSFEFSKGTQATYEHLALLIFQLLWILVIFIFATAIFVILNINKKNEILKLKIENIQNELISQKIITALDQERNRFSSELHDTIAQDIKAEQFFVEDIISSIKKTQKNNDTIEKIIFLEKRINTQIRLLIKNLSANNFRAISLSNAVKDFCEETSVITNIKCTFFMSENCKIEKKTSPEQNQQIFRIIQESVNNAVKHSSCTEIKVLIRQNKEEKIAIFITDDGKGFDPKKDIKKNSFGIKGIKDRAKILNAKVTFESEKDNGTTVKLEL